MLDKTKRYLIVGLGLLGGKYALELSKAGLQYVRNNNPGLFRPLTAYSHEKMRIRRQTSGDAHSYPNGRRAYPQIVTCSRPPRRSDPLRP